MEHPYFGDIPSFEADIQVVGETPKPLDITFFTSEYRISSSDVAVFPSYVDIISPTERCGEEVLCNSIVGNYLDNLRALRDAGISVPEGRGIFNIKLRCRGFFGNQKPDSITPGLVREYIEGVRLKEDMADSGLAEKCRELLKLEVDKARRLGFWVDQDAYCLENGVFLPNDRKVYITNVGFWHQPGTVVSSEEGWLLDPKDVEG